MTSADRNPGTPAAHVNDVHLVGVLSATQLRTLPSGDQLHTFRVTVRRPPARRPSAASADATGPAPRRSPSVDAIDCVAATAAARRSLAACTVGEPVEVAGRLQRRFWRSPTGPASAYQVEAVTIRRASAPRRRPTSAS